MQWLDEQMPVPLEADHSLRGFWVINQSRCNLAADGREQHYCAGLKTVAHIGYRCYPLLKGRAGSGSDLQRATYSGHHVSSFSS